MIVIHIGLRKSGSSTLQNFLSSNEPYLTAHQVLYPRCTRHHNNHHNIAHELLGSKQFEADVGGMAELVHHWRGMENMQTMVLSSEVFERFDAEEIAALHQGLAAARPGEDFKIVLIVRDLVDLVPSSYGQKIKYGRHSYDFDQYFEQMLEEQRVDYFKTAARWAQEFGWGRLAVRALDRRFLVNGDLIDDFLSVLGIDPRNETGLEINRTGLRNTCFGWRVQEAVRALYAGTHDLPEGHPALKAMKQSGDKALALLARDLGEEFGWLEDKGHYLTRDQAQRCLEVYRRNVDALNERLSSKLPRPVDLDERRFVARQQLPSAGLIPPGQLTRFYDQLGALWLEKQRTAKRTNKRQRPQTAAPKRERDRAPNEAVLHAAM
jgi:hypothetical protein